MGLFRSLVTFARDRLDRTAPVTLLDLPPLADERELAAHLLRQTSVIAALGAAGIDAAQLAHAVAQASPGDRRAARQSLERLNAHFNQSLSATEELETPLPALHLRLFVLLFVTTSPGTRAALTAPGLAPGAFPFFVAHGATEDTLTAAWPRVGTDDRRVAIENDAYSPMEAVVECLCGAFAFDRETALRKMLGIHFSGALQLAAPAGSSSLEFCLRHNTRWRAQSLPLYCRPVAEPARATATLMPSR